MMVCRFAGGAASLGRLALRARFSVTAGRERQGDYCGFSLVSQGGRLGDGMRAIG